jgi:hypothetical protein
MEISSRAILPVQCMPPSVSIIILTKNEASNLPECLAALVWCDDIHVVDSGSTNVVSDMTLVTLRLATNHA